MKTIIKTNLIPALFILAGLLMPNQTQSEQYMIKEVKPTISNDYAMAYSYCLKIRYNEKEKDN